MLLGYYFYITELIQCYLKAPEGSSISTKKNKFLCLGFKSSQFGSVSSNWNMQHMGFLCHSVKPVFLEPPTCFANS